MPKTILQIDASARGIDSESRKLSQSFITGWQSVHPEDVIITRDITENPLPHIDSSTLNSLMIATDERTPEQQIAAMRVDELIDEFMAADVLVLAVPMYNFGIPSTLKAWVDHVSIAGRTFEYTANGPKGLVKEIKVYLISTRGGIYGESPMDHQVNYLKTLFDFLGIDNVEVIQAEGLNLSPEERDSSITAALSKIEVITTASAA
ncbi:MAG: FMN-dependent NADH-azoreductase [Gammaproteobacteria bacterium]|nr:FMN-dependent NADH-azoreductase [Gammaproteobacteria bacterium]